MYIYIYILVDITPRMENHIEHQMENDMEGTAYRVIQGLYNTGELNGESNGQLTWKLLYIGLYEDYLPVLLGPPHKAKNREQKTQH